jgi:hypothetical protein
MSFESNNMLDSWARLNKFRQDNGLFRDEPAKFEEYFRENRLREKVKEAINLIGMAALCELSGLTRMRIEEISGQIIYDLGDRMLRNAWNIYQADGVGELLRYLHDVNPG